MLNTSEDGNIQKPVKNFTDHHSNSRRDLILSSFSVTTPEQKKYVKPLDPASTWHLLQKDQKQAAYYVSNLITHRNSQVSGNYWLHTPENPGYPDEHTPVQQRILHILQALQDMETLDPTKDAES